ncbi:MAG: M23 family metallopeptidase, partial [Acutalibacteraceae bacterium]|nr:M23 family metallopeptidase [Acutalibacteraceae bacterium]
KVVAKDASGTTKTLVNNAFTVKATTKLETFKSNALANWVKPVRATCLTVPGTGRAFGASRSSGTRAHAGIDYYVRGGSGTPVYAMQSGKVIEYIANFYYGTSCVAIQHADGSIARYAEISTSLGVGKTVTKGQQIGKIVANTLDGGTMLHLELYLGTASGSLTNRTNKTYDYASGTKYQRRRDLVNPEFLLQITRTK